MEELKINGQYEKEDGKRIMRLIDEIKVRGMRLAKIVDENDMSLIANIIAMRLLQYSAEKQVERDAKETAELEDKFLHGLLLAERDNTLMTVEEYLGTVEDADFDRIVIHNKNGEVLYCGDRNADVPGKFAGAQVDHAELSEYLDADITLAREE